MQNNIMGSRKKYRLASFGVVALLLYNVFAAAKDVAIGNQASQYNPYLMTASVFLIAMLFFQSAVLITDRRKLVAPKGRASDHLWLNITTAVSWLSLYFSLSLVEPALVSALIGGLNPICTLIINKMLRPGSIVAPTEILGSLAIGLVGTYLAWVVVSGNSGLEYEDSSSAWKGLGYASIAAVSFSATTVYSKRLHDRGLSSATVMAHRFYLLVIGAVLMSGGMATFLSFLQEQFAIMLLISFFGVIVSLFLLQEGTRLCEPMTVEMIIAIAPALTLIFQLFDSRVEISYHSIFANVLLVGIVVVVVYFQMKDQRHA